MKLNGRGPAKGKALCEFIRFKFYLKKEKYNNKALCELKGNT